MKGRKKLPDDERRVLVFGRVTPQTAAVLDTLPADNRGRAIDKLAQLYQTVRTFIHDDSTEPRPAA